MEAKIAFEEMEKADKALRSQSWEIIHFISGLENVFSKRKDGLWYGLFGALNEEDILKSKEHTIFSIKRLKDNEIFTIGDNVKAGFKEFRITGFSPSSYGIIVKGSALHSIDYLNEINHV